MTKEAELGQIFLNRIKEKISRGEFDSKITVPLMSRESIFNMIKIKVNRKIAAGTNPLLSEYEINDSISSAKDLAVVSFFIFRQMNVLEFGADGWGLSKKGKKLIHALKSSQD